MKDSIGAMWLKTSKAGNKFMSGVVEVDGVKTKIVVFKNDRKENEKQPDYKIYLSEDKKREENDDNPF